MNISLIMFEIRASVFRSVENLLLKIIVKGEKYLSMSVSSMNLVNLIANILTHHRVVAECKVATKL